MTYILQVLVVFCLITAFLSALKKHKKQFHQSRLTHSEFIRNIVVDTIGILLAMILAGWTGRTLAQILTAPITHDLAKLIAGILVGILVGICIGLLIKKTWGRLVKT
jgi:F0F1-type ATP synthase assembly protein I